MHTNMRATGGTEAFMKRMEVDPMQSIMSSVGGGSNAQGGGFRNSQEGHTEEGEFGHGIVKGSSRPTSFAG